MSYVISGEVAEAAQQALIAETMLQSRGSHDLWYFCPALPVLLTLKGCKTQNVFHKQLSITIISELWHQSAVSFKTKTILQCALKNKEI